MPDSRQIIDGAPKTEDIFIDNELFSDSDNKYIFIRYIFHIFCYQKGTKKMQRQKKKKKNESKV